jgi:site-specific recombinase XerD
MSTRNGKLPPELQPEPVHPPKQVLTLGDGFGLFARGELYKTAKYPDRYRACIYHLEKHFNEKFPVKDLWVPEIREYRVQRQFEGAKAATINREVGTLSRIFQVLMEHRLVESNPCRLLERLSEKAGQREIYISYEDFNTMLDQTWDWFRPILWTAYLSGMRRRGEIQNLEKKGCGY